MSERDALADADAHRGKRALAAELREVMRGGERYARARHAERMAQCNRTAVRIDVFGVVGKAELAHAGERLRRKRLVQLPKINVVHLETQTLEDLGHGKDRTYAHFIGLTARDCKS